MLGWFIQFSTDRGEIRHITLAVYTRIGLVDVLGSINSSVPLYHPFLSEDRDLLSIHFLRPLTVNLLAEVAAYSINCSTAQVSQEDQSYHCRTGSTWNSR